MRSSSTFALVVSALFTASCAHQKPASAPVAQTKENPVIVHIVNRHNTITVRATGHGPLYSVTDKSGKTLVASATLADLRANHPDLYRQIAPALADESATASNSTGHPHSTSGLRSTSGLQSIPIAVDSAR